MDIAYLGHGRKDPYGQCDVSRTVGFFASQFPLVFCNAPSGDLVDTLYQVQTTLSTGMDNGFLYTVFKNLHCSANDQIDLKQQFDVQTQFEFTYLDDLSLSWNTAGGLDIITNFNSRQFRVETIGGLMSHWKNCLLELSRV
ncbi:hypothetical protein BJ085DRAFT_31284 [Dimargaris cristalligena]|uniref:Condensation domain-containing protein n=1 Tax=Dimargaris cristalligena TaxID=215637 RepID=A0A4P9ZJ89_9FUNG|nr:hypothetical protein BJ085DRAFT_31284 [Dimargaris cristalligena]|eukprot:RKP33267.1 hypothetical protein BJ085DRAFT_31284 [Dimargaris cristalligena]